MKIILDGTQQKLADELPGHAPFTTHVKIQNPSGNGLLKVGRSGQVDYEIAAGVDELFPEKNLHNLWVQGTNLETINVFFGNNQ